MKKIIILSSIVIIIISFLVIYRFKASYESVKGTFISLAPSITEIIYAIGAEDKLVAVSDYCNYPEEAKTKPRAGGLFYPSDEKILKYKPEYILALDDQRYLVENLKQFGIKIYYFKYSDLDSIFTSIVKIGVITKHEAPAKQLVDEMKKEGSLYHTQKPKTLLFVIQVEPLVTIGKDSFITDIIKKAGHKSITTNIDKSYPEVSLEYVFANKPDIIVATQKHQAEFLKQFIDTEYKILTSEEESDTSRPGPRIMKSLKIFSSI